MLDCARSTTRHPSGTGETSSLLSCLLCSFATDSQTVLLDHINGHPVGDGDPPYYYTQQTPGAGPHQNQVPWSVGSTSGDATGTSAIRDTSAPISHPGGASFHLQEELHGSPFWNLSAHRGSSGTNGMEVAGASLSGGAKRLQPTPNTSGKNRFSCPLCPYASRNRTHVAHHIRIHTKERPFRCHVCLRTFAQKQHLVRHSAIHSGQTRHKCKMCPGKSFKSGTELALHMCSHTGKKPLQCSVCSRAFLIQSKFVRHMSTHSSKEH